MELHKFFAIIALVIISSHLPAQGDVSITVRKPNSESGFTYSGKPVSPIALISIFPAMVADEDKPDTVDLGRFPFPKTIHIDTMKEDDNKQVIRYRAGFRYSQDYSRQYAMDSGDVGMQGEVAAYKVLGKTKGNKFIVHGYLNYGGYWTQEFIFILEIKGDRLLKLGGFGCDVSRDQNGMRYPVLISDEKIINGSRQYTIPISAL